MANQAEKKEVQDLLEALNRSCKRGRSRKTLLLKIATGYAAMALFTTAALIFSAVNLGAINTTARRITFAELPAISALMRLRTALVAQERFAGKYAILKDPSFVELFRQREQEFLSNLRVLRQTGSLQEHLELDRLYAGYQTATQRLFSGQRGASDEERAAAARVFKAIGDYHVERQAKLHSVIERADRQRRSTIKWTAAIACAGFLLTVWIAPLVTSRIFSATRRLQMATHSALAGDFSYSPEMAAYEEIGDLAEDVAALAGKLAELEQLNFAPLPNVENPVTGRILEEQLRRGEEVAFCDARIDELSFIAAQHGYLKATRLIRMTTYLLQVAARELGCPGYVGHVGGNSFLMLLPPDKVRAVCEGVIPAFEREVREIFSSCKMNGDGGTGRSALATTIGITALVRAAGAAIPVAELAGALDRLEELTAAKGPGSRWHMAPLSPAPDVARRLPDEADSTTEAREES